MYRDKNNEANILYKGGLALDKGIWKTWEKGP